MRKIVVLTFISLDGIMQAPGGPDEDTSGGFKYGGWTAPYMDEYAGKMMLEQMGHPFDLLLGRKTYDIFANYWPKIDVEKNQIAKAFDGAKKYVVSHQSFEPSWAGSTLITGDVVSQIKERKAGDGPEFQVHGSGNFIQTLMKNDLVDEFWLKIFPVTLGLGKKLFEDGTIPAAFTLEKHSTSPTGVIYANYKRAGEVKTGSLA